MSRTATMATGFFLILMGIQLHVVETFTMTPRVAHFLNDNFSQDQQPIASPPIAAFDPRQPNVNLPNSPYYQAGFNNSQPVAIVPAAISRAFPSTNGDEVIRPPRWICWPVLFLGAFLLIQGATQNRR